MLGDEGAFLEKLCVVFKAVLLCKRRNVPQQLVFWNAVQRVLDPTMIRGAAVVIMMISEQLLDHKEYMKNVLGVDVVSEVDFALSFDLLVRERVFLVGRHELGRFSEGEARSHQEVRGLVGGRGG